MLDRLKAFLQGADSPTEDGSQRDGLLSYALEWHALILGLGAGLASGLVGRPEYVVLVIGIALGVRAAPTKRLQQVKAEPWYAISGVLLGYGAAVLDLALNGLSF